ncbi:MAG: hypothetical protein ACRDDY_00475, partial [Clostridium sp.]|uniref:hypothetical protein n=1 Tax=Clostridium sp. TaxID=1506 RepID=UPI003EE6C6AF
MKKKLISILTCLTIFAGLGTTAFAEGVSHKTTPTKASTSVSDSKTKPIKVSDNYRYVKSELLNGATVSTIKSNL